MVGVLWSLRLNNPTKVESVQELLEKTSMTTLSEQERGSAWEEAASLAEVTDQCLQALPAPVLQLLSKKISTLRLGK